MRRYLYLFTLISLTGLLATAAGNVSSISSTARQTAVAQNDSAVFVNSGQSLGGATGNGVALGDLDGDGDPDAFVANDYSSIGPEANQIWFNNGNGFFTAGPMLGTANGHAVALGDLDGDGDLDALVAGVIPGQVWLNQGGTQGGNQGDFAAGVSFGSFTSYGVALGDVDKDGDRDALIVGNSNQLWLNNGDATFAAGPALSPPFSRDAVLADLDGDGWLDAIIVDSASGSNNQVWWNDGNWNSGPGSFTPGPLLPLESLVNSVAVADLDGDGRLDIFLAGTGPNQIFWNEGVRTFSTAGPLPVNDNSSVVTLADVNGDGRADAVVGNTHAHPIRLWRNNGSRVFTVGQEFGNELGLFWSRGLGLADLNGDGSPDLFEVTTGDDRVWFNQSTAPPPAGADLSVTITGVGYVGAEPADVPFLPQSFTVTVHNLGPGPATGVAVQGAYEFSGGSQGECALFPWCDAWLFGNLAPGQSATVTYGPIFGSLFTVGAIHHVAAANVSVAGLEVDPDLRNNRAAFTTHFLSCEQIWCITEKIFCKYFGVAGGAMQASDGSEGPEEDGLAFGTNLASWRGPLRSLEEAVIDLVVYYLVRDRVLLGTADGHHYVDLYHSHDPEITALLQADDGLEAEGIATLQLWEPNLWALVTGQGDSAIITAEQVAAIDSFLTNLTAVASPELQQVIAEERARLGPPEDYVGMTMSEARGLIVGYGIKLPIVTRE